MLHQKRIVRHIWFHTKKVEKEFEIDNSRNLTQNFIEEKNMSQEHISWVPQSTILFLFETKRNSVNLFE